MQLKTQIKNAGTLQKTFIAVFVVLAVVAASYPYDTVSKTVEVSRVIDGDTFKAEVNGETQSIRLKGVDTPETSGYNSPGEFKGVEQSDWKCLQKWGYNAKDYASKKVGETAEIRYRKGLLTVERGSFGRIIAEVKLGNSTLGKQMMQKGMARGYGTAYAELEKEARKKGVGLWSCSS